MSKKEFRMPMGRLATVMADANYGEVTKYKVNDFFNQKNNKTPRFVKKEECSLKGCKDSPYHQNDVKNLMKGQPDKKYNKNDIFDTGKDKDKNKKKVSKSKNKKPIKQYKNDFHTLY